MTTAEDLLRLLPAVHRVRDAVAAGRPGPLHELVEVLATQADVVDADLADLADAWFIETCADWLVPYLGELLGATPMHAIGTAAAQPRAYVARTLEYRQAKGTVAVLEQLARDVTGWPTRAVEMFPQLAWSQHLDHVRLDRTATPDLHDPEHAALVDGPFDATPRTVEVRRLAGGRGRWNLPNVVLFAYRLQPQTIERAPAVPGDAPGRWHVDPLRRDVPLFNPGRAEARLVDLAQEPDLPGPLRRRPLADEVESLRDPAVRASHPQWFTSHRPVVHVEVRPAPDEPWEPIPPAELVVCDLEPWRPPPALRRYPDPQDPDDHVERPIRAALDPDRGRVAFRADAAPRAVRTTHTTATPMPLGGGPYDRRDLPRPEGVPPRQRFLVGQDLTPRDGIFATLTDAVAAWRADPTGTSEIVVTDSGVYHDDLRGPHALELAEQVTLRIVAAQTQLPGAGQLPDPSTPLHRAGVRPVLTGPISVRGVGADPDGAGGLTFDGVWLAGGLNVLVGNLAELTLVDATLVPGHAPLDVRAGGAGRNQGLELQLVRSISGPLLLGDTTRALRLHTSIVDGGEQAIDAARAEVTVHDSTLLGGLQSQSLEAHSTIFTDQVSVARIQTGCVRYCVLPLGPAARTPRRYRCQPELALAAAADPDTGEIDPQIAAAIRGRMRPMFTSRQHGHPAYCQLARGGAPEIAAGAEDGSEMGAHRALQQPARQSNLATALSEYLRAGLEAAAVPVT